MAIRKHHILAGLLALSISVSALADVPDYTLRYSTGIGFGPGESISGNTVGYNKFVSGGAKGEIEISVAPIPAINAAVSNSNPLTDVFVFGSLFYNYQVAFSAANGLIFNDLNIVDITGVAALAGTDQTAIFANVNDGLVSWTCTNGVGACAVNNFATVGSADSYIETDQFDGTSIYTLSGRLLLNGAVYANAANEPGSLAKASLYLDPTIGLNNAFATTNNASNVLVQLSPGVANASGPPVPLNAVPEPASWAMLIAGFGLVGTMQRRRRSVAA